MVQFWFTYVPCSINIICIGSTILFFFVLHNQPHFFELHCCAGRIWSCWRNYIWLGIWHFVWVMFHIKLFYLEFSSAKIYDFLWTKFWVGIYWHARLWAGNRTWFAMTEANRVSMTELCRLLILLLYASWKMFIRSVHWRFFFGRKVQDNINKVPRGCSYM